jgi:hypothetical protein
LWGLRRQDLRPRLLDRAGEGLDQWRVTHSGFLGHVETGPFRTFFLGLAGSPVVDVLFMLGMLAVGVALILGAAYGSPSPAPSSC